MIRHEHVTGNVLGYLGMKRCHPSDTRKKTGPYEMCGPVCWLLKCLRTLCGLDVE